MVSPRLFVLFAAGLAFASAYVNYARSTREAVGLLAIAVFWLAASAWLRMEADHDSQ